MAVGIVLWGLAFLLRTWDAGAAPDGGAIPPTSSVWMAGENSGLSLWKITCHRTRVALVDTALFSLILVVVIGSVRSLGLTLDVGGRRFSLRNRSKEHILLNSWPELWHL